MENLQIDPMSVITHAFVSSLLSGTSAFASSIFSGLVLQPMANSISQQLLAMLSGGTVSLPKDDVPPFFFNKLPMLPPPFIFNFTSDGQLQVSFPISDFINSLFNMVSTYQNAGVSNQ